MKIITTLIGILGFQYAFCQNTPSAQEAPVSSVYAVAYSESAAALVHEDASPVKCSEISITSLPPATQSVTTLNIEFGKVGTFTFKKDPSLEVYNDRDVYIEDMLTGKVFDLKNAESYTFNVNRRIPSRFVLHIDKMLLKYAVSLK